MKLFRRDDEPEEEQKNIFFHADEDEEVEHIDIYLPFNLGKIKWENVETYLVIGGKRYPINLFRKDKK